MLHRIAPVILTLSLIAGCAADHPGRDRERIIGEHVFTVGYSRIADIYLNPVDLRRLTLDGLSGLEEMDPRIGLVADDKLLQAKLDGRLVGEFPLPDRNAPGPWAEVTSRVIERLRANSDRLDTIPREDLYQAVFDAIIVDLDGYSRYTSASRADDERSQREGYGGIGIAVRHENGHHEVREVMPGGPAAAAGIKLGDLILVIDGEFTTGMTPEQIGERLRGPAGTSVAVTVGETVQSSRHLTVRRDRVIPSTVTAEAVDGVGIIRIDRFNAATALNVREAVRNLRDRSPHGYVLDLRGNPGGLLDQAVSVADQFIRQGRIISTRGRHPDSMQQFDATPDDVLDGLPLVVLVDGRSASAAEIVAAALQDSGRAVVVGASSFGKGSVQTVTRLPNDGELFLTWSRLYAPSGYTLHRQGVQPSICTSNDVTTAEQALVTISGATRAPLPPSTLALWRQRAPDDEKALAQLRGACPWKEHAPELDLVVARTLLADPALYRRALSLTQTNLAER